jgi:hypothetical protein
VERRRLVRGRRGALCSSSFAPHQLPDKLLIHQFELLLTRLLHGSACLQGSLSFEDSGEGSDVIGEEGEAVEESDSSEDEVRKFASRVFKLLNLLIPGKKFCLSVTVIEVGVHGIYVTGLAILFRWRRGTQLATCRLSGTRTRVISAMTLMGGRSKSEVGRMPLIRFKL